ncbi:hypothetical protein CUT44_25390 [Streptomyces carminius]|uniref:Uncharacterized protein n=1 Tax=Streptomyces carminius TaxID=2665496 RepID=A0A2M8LSR1_9ACTN|nr:hypothetical protein [Streptomyces carminius]PJE94997.1 hypothetical protein CUT44_25390 [Streptomyces carminius]
MTHTAGGPPVRARGRLAGIAEVSGIPAFGARPGTRRHPLVAVAMVLPLAALLAVVFGGVEAVVVQASSVAGLLGL